MILYIWKFSNFRRISLWSVIQNAPECGDVSTLIWNEINHKINFASSSSISVFKPFRIFIQFPCVSTVVELLVLFLHSQEIPLAQFLIWNIISEQWHIKHYMKTEDEEGKNFFSGSMCRISNSKQSEHWELFRHRTISHLSISIESRKP